MVKTTAGKRKSIFNDDDNGKRSDSQTVLHSFFAPTSKQKMLPSSHKSAAKKPPPARVSQSPKKKEQLYLDLGQRNFGTAECPLCGMLFVHGLQEDTEVHKKVCNDYKSGVAFSNRIKCRSIGQANPSKIVEVRAIAMI